MCDQEDSIGSIYDGTTDSANVINPESYVPPKRTIMATKMEYNKIIRNKSKPSLPMGKAQNNNKYVKGAASETEIEINQKNLRHCKVRPVSAVSDKVRKSAVVTSGFDSNALTESDTDLYGESNYEHAPSKYALRNTKMTVRTTVNGTRVKKKARKPQALTAGKVASKQGQIMHDYEDSVTKIDIKTDSKSENKLKKLYHCEAITMCSMKELVRKEPAFIYATVHGQTDSIKSDPLIRFDTSTDSLQELSCEYAAPTRALRRALRAPMRNKKTDAHGASCYENVPPKRDLRVTRVAANQTVVKTKPKMPQTLNEQGIASKQCQTKQDQGDSHDSIYDGSTESANDSDSDSNVPPKRKRRIFRKKANNKISRNKNNPSLQMGKSQGNNKYRYVKSDRETEIGTKLEKPHHNEVPANTGMDLYAESDHENPPPKRTLRNARMATNKVTTANETEIETKLKKPQPVKGRWKKKAVPSFDEEDNKEHRILQPRAVTSKNTTRKKHKVDKKDEPVSCTTNKNMTKPQAKTLTINKASRIQDQTNTDQNNTSDVENNSWDDTEIALYKKALRELNTGMDYFWHNVALRVGPLKSAKQCQAYHQECAPPPVQKKKYKRPGPKAGKGLKSGLTGGVGTLKRKRELKQLMNNFNEDYEDNLFNSTPARTIKRFKMPLLEVDDDDFYQNRPNTETPIAERNYRIPNSNLSWMPAADKTPLTCMVTPSGDNTVEKKNKEAYVHRRMEGWKQGKRCLNKAQAEQKSMKAKSSVRKVSKPLHPNLFALEQLDDDEDNSDQEEDYYFSD